MEVHTIISHYFIECMDSSEALFLSPNFGMSTANSVSKGLRAAFQESYGVQDISLLTPVDHLKYKVSEIENDALPYHIKKSTCTQLLTLIMLYLYYNKGCFNWFTKY